MDKVRIGFVGLGPRGRGLLNDIVLQNPKAQVTAVCDVYSDRTEEGAKLVEEKSGAKPFASDDYRDIVTRDDVDAVVIASAWESHIPIAIAALEAGKKVGMEVGGAYTVEQCFELVKCVERTGVPLMLLENCCYGRRELMVRNMVELGVLGEVVHCAGGYMHDLREEVAFGKERRHYRLRNYINRNCENYPTHELGPIAKVLGINRGNRMVSLVSMASKARGLHEYIMQKKSDDAELVGTHFNQGDIVSTIIKCAGGETITLSLDTTLPRYYSRGFTVRGTKGMYEEATDSVFLDGGEHSGRRENWGNAEKYSEKYEHPIWKAYKESGVQGSHDGMDWLEFDRFFDAILEDKPFEIDVYDAAAWMCITALSEQSVALGGTPVAIPDFTNGMWTMRK